MSVTVQIKQKSIFKKKLNIDDIINLTDLSYGVSDENFRLIRDEKANHTLIYDKTKLARGIDLWLEGTDIMLSLSLPTSSSEIKLFYNVIEKICNKLNISKYLRDDVQVNICDNKKYIKYDEDTSVVALEDIEAKTGDSYQRFELFGVFNPDIMNLLNTVEAVDINVIKLILYGGMILYLIYVIVYYMIGKKQFEKGVNVE